MKKVKYTFFLFAIFFSGSALAYSGMIRVTNLNSNIDAPDTNGTKSLVLPIEIKDKATGSLLFTVKNSTKSCAQTTGIPLYDIGRLVTVNKAKETYKEICAFETFSADEYTHSTLEITADGTVFLQADVADSRTYDDIKWLNGFNEDSMKIEFNLADIK